jgi:hypothetical protein
MRGHSTLLIGLDLHEYQAVNEFIVYVAASLVALWGVAHAIPTAQVVPGFAPITVDNRRVLTQEWLAEAFTMWGVSPPSSWWRRHSGGRDRM